MRSPTIVIEELGGNCPVQAEGTIDKVPFYFRARGDHWSIRVAMSKFGVWGEDAFYHEELYKGGEQYAAGWMPTDEARGFIQRGAELYAKTQQSEEECVS